MPTNAEMQALVPAAVQEVCETLRAAGYQAWVVGGAVRDLLLGKVPSDWDVASDCLPEKVLTLFKHTIATGLQHGTVTAVVGSGRSRENVEITTFRGEGAYSDGRRPDAVSFGVPLDEDLKRRDFVINAMAFDPVEGKVHDPFGGTQDLEAGCVRAVGEASERFNEDGLRVMRAVRFVSTLGFALDAATEEGLASALNSLSKVAQERVRVELLKLLGGKAAPLALAIAERNGVLRVILPELAALDASAAFGRVERLPHDEVLRLAGLLAELELDVLEAVLRRLTMSNDDRQRVMSALRLYTMFAGVLPDESNMRRHLSAVGRGACADHLLLQAAAHSKDEPAIGGKIELANRLLQVGVPLEVSDLAIGGRDIIALTGVKGPAVGLLLRELLERVLDEPSLNDAKSLEALAIELAKSLPE